MTTERQLVIDAVEFLATAIVASGMRADLGRHCDYDEIARRAVRLVREVARHLSEEEPHRE